MHKNKDQIIKQLAHDMATHAKTIRYQIIPALITKTVNEPDHELNQIFSQYKNELKPTASIDEFADFIAQITVTSLLAAFCLTQTPDVQKLSSMIPTHQPVISSILDYLTHANSNEWTPCLNAIISRLYQAPTINLLFSVPDHEPENDSPTDPFNLYAETFLTDYDPSIKETYGIYFTPPPAVAFIVRSTQYLLTQTLTSDGWNDNHVRIIEPSLGTASFLSTVLGSAQRQSNKNNNQPVDSTLPHLYGFEIMPTPYLLSLLRLTLLLGPKKAPNLLNRMVLTDTLNLNLTNGQTICSHLSPDDIPVIIGNPPYNGYQHHTNDTETSGPQRKRKEDESISAVKFLIQTYLTVNGQRIDERVTKGLSAAYVQFIRLAQWLVDQTEQGIVAFVTNHAYLDNPTFRAMRHALMTSFDAIYILDLNGHVRKKESPNGTGGNIFDTRQGTAISFLIKKKGHDATVPGKVFYKEVTGNREEKYAFLNANDWSSISWESVQPTPKFYSFKPIREHRPSMGTNTNPYRDFFPIRDIFRMSGVGIITGRDKLCYSRHAEDMLVKAAKFSAMQPDAARETYHLQPDSRDWTIQTAQKDITESLIERNRVMPVLYRPFEIRYTYYTGKSKGFLCMPRPQMTDQMRMDNIALITVRQVAEGDFNHVLVSDVMADARVTAGPQGIAHVFPLYVYTHIEPAERHALRGTGFPNFHSEFVDRLNET
ncbi:MAG: type ISP restriction/modification enzyme, partial [Candidatus Omnitrophota bacterium]